MKDDFKIGDWVVLINNEYHSSNDIGDIGIITESEDNCAYRVVCKNGIKHANWSHYSDLRKATPKEIAKATGKPINIDAYEIY